MKPRVEATKIDGTSQLKTPSPARPAGGGGGEFPQGFSPSLCSAVWTHPNAQVFGLVRDLHGHQTRALIGDHADIMLTVESQSGTSRVLGRLRWRPEMLAKV